MLAKDDSSISEFTFTLYEMNEDEKICEQCLAREMYEHDRASAIAGGFERGHKEGLHQGHVQLTELYKKLAKSNRTQDFLQACSDGAYLEQLLKELLFLI